MNAMKDEDQQQLAQLKAAAKILLQPFKNLPFPVVMEAMTGFAIHPLQSQSADTALLKSLADCCVRVCADSHKTPILANRSNDVSVQVERLLEAALNDAGRSASKPHAKAGRSPGGYPDLVISGDADATYLEVKVSREENINQGSARNFSSSP